MELGSGLDFLAEDSGQWWALMPTVMCLCFRKRWRKSCLPERLLTCQKGVFFLWVRYLYMVCMSPSSSFAILASCNISLFVQSRKWPIRELHYFVSTDTCVPQYLLSSENTCEQSAPPRLPVMIELLDFLLPISEIPGLELVHRSRILAGYFVGFPSPPGDCRCMHRQLMSLPFSFQGSSAHPLSYLVINLQVIQRPYITYEPIKLTTWPNRHLLNRSSSEYLRNG
jgi:hypothetical protein